MRRRVALGSIAGVSAATLVGCGAEEEPTTAPTPTPTPSETVTPSETPSETPQPSASPPHPALGATREVPVGGGRIYAEERVVVTQPSKGDFKAFTSTCTHMGCTVASVTDGLITCPCHGSRFSIEDGSVQGGPAPGALAAVPIKVQGGRIVRG